MTMNNRTKSVAVLGGTLWAVASFGQSVVTPDLKAPTGGKGWKTLSPIAATWKDDAPDVKPRDGVIEDFSSFSTNQWALPEGKTKIAEAADADGRKRPVLIVNSCKQVVPLRDYQFTDGTIEFDFRGGAWLGVSFHVTENGNQADIIYFRNPKVAGWERSIRYYCRMSAGSGKYTELSGVESGTIPLPPTVGGADLLKSEGWVKVKCVIAGKQAVIYINEEEKPAFTIENLHLAGQSGSVGLYGWTGAFAGFRVQKATPVALSGERR